MNWWQPGNNYGGWNPQTGQPQDWWDTGYVQDDVLGTDSANRGVFERFLTENGFGGYGRNAQLMRNLYNQSLSGQEAAQLSNPGLTYYDYLQQLGPGFLNQQVMAMGPQQRGDYTPARTTWMRW